MNNNDSIINKEINKEKIKKVINYFTSKKEIKNSDRRGILFSKLPSQQVNPDRYDSLMTFWNNSLTDICRQYNIIIFTPKSLSNYFTVDNVSPIYLPLILNEMIKIKLILKLEEFIKQDGGWSRWIWNKVIVQPFQYYTGLSSGNNLDGNEKNLKFVVPEIVREKSEQLYQFQVGRMNSTTDNIVSIVNLEKSIKEWMLTREELELLLSVLVKDGKALLLMVGQEKMGVKFAFDGEKVVAPIQETDFGILKLQSTYETLKQQENKLLIDIEDINVEIKKSVRLKQKNHALQQLKKKKLLESILEKRSTASTNIHEILFSIESAKSNQQIIDTLCTGVSTLKKVNQQISVDQVDSILDDYQDAITDQREIDDAMKSGFNNIESISSLDLDDMDKLEKELDQMEQDHLNKEKEEKQKLKEQQQAAASTTTTTTTTTQTYNPNLPIPNKNEEDDLLKELELLTVSSSKLPSSETSTTPNKQQLNA